ncbi:MAG: J domain-containing protein [Acidimicrobiia bacterium]
MTFDPADPFAVFDLTSSATLDELRAARRRLAKLVHPDHVGGDAERMQTVNRAFDLAVKQLRARPRTAGGVSGSPGPSSPTPPTPAPPRPRQPPRSGRWIDVDEPSFTIDVLPAEAFEALSIVTAWHGEVIDDDPPYVLDVLLWPPFDCVCRLTLMPEAGGSMVSLTVAAIDRGQPPPSAESVRDLYVAGLNSLGPV